MAEEPDRELSKCTGQSLPQLPVCKDRETCRRFLLVERPGQSWIVMPDYLNIECGYFVDDRRK